ncbi:MAG: hypothetical protein ABWY33_05875 [Cellulomonas sp.]
MTVDCANPGLLARFWGEALEYVGPPPPDGFATWDAWAEHHEVPQDDRDELCVV